MNKTRIHLLFQRYLHGSCSEAEKDELIRHLSDDSDPQAQKLLEQMWSGQNEKLSEEKSEHILNSILATSDNVVPIRSHHWLKIAAAISLLLLGSVAFYQLIPSQTETSMASRTPEQSADQKYLTLPDGSRVILNNASRLEYAGGFSDNTKREVYLTGEAYFDIMHDASRPFIVHTEKISTTVLGTAFNIKAYPEQNDITITVTRGKVRVSDETQVLGILTHDEQITFQKNNEAFQKETVQSEEVTSWMEKDIFFDDVSMADAVSELGERFDVNIILKNPELGSCRFTATFVQGEDLYQIMDVICEFNKSEYNVDSKTGDIEVTGNGCPQ